LPLALLWAFSFALLCLFPLRYKNSVDVCVFETRYHSNPWVLSMLAQKAFAQGDTDKAVSLCEKAYKLEASGLRLLKYAKALYVQGKFSGRDFEKMAADSGQSEILFISALKYLEEVHFLIAKKVFYKSADLCSSQENMVRRTVNPDEKEFAARLESQGFKNCVSRMDDYIMILPKGRRKIALKRLEAICPGCSGSGYFNLGSWSL